jgi:hypothetical protein
MSSLLDAVNVEHQKLAPALRDSALAVLVRTLARSIDAAREPAAVSNLSKEFRAASAALREAVLQAGERGDRVDDLAAARAARRRAAPADPGSPAVGKQ